MKSVLIDTNVLVSALVFPAGVAAQAFRHVAAEQRLALTQQVIDESSDVVGRKWPHLLGALDRFLAGLEYDLLPIAASGMVIRDATDQPILDAAIGASVDVILTGDKDFHDLIIAHPKVMTPRTYLDSKLRTGDGTVSYNSATEIAFPCSRRDWRGAVLYQGC